MRSAEGAPLESGPGATARASERGLAWLACGLGAAWVVLCVPLLAGDSTFYYRDLWNIFLPLKAFGASALAEGQIPAVNPTWALGQPFRGNPNALAYYPSNLAYLLLPFWSAFNLHQCAHWWLAALGMGALARASGTSRAAALLAALSFAGSGWMLSSLTFYNLVAVAAWLPILMLGLLRGGARGHALAGLAAGLGLLAGEPVTFAVAALGIAIWAIGTLGARPALGRLAWAAAIGLLLAAPQIVATLRVTPFSFRTQVGITPFGASYFSLHPFRFLELLLPLPFGTPDLDAGFREWTRGWLPPIPFQLSIHLGVVALFLAPLAVRRHRLLAALALGGWLLAWAGGVLPGPLAAATFGLFRSPEKLVVWPALALPLLAAAGLDRALETLPRRWRGVTLAAAAACALLALVAAGFAAAGVAVPSRAWALQLGVASALLGLLVLALERGWRTGVVALQLAGLLQLSPLWMTDRVDRLALEPPWSQALPRGAAIVTAHLGHPTWRDTVANPELPPGPPADLYRIRNLELASATGVRRGWSYPLAPDLDGLTHVFFNHLIVRMALADWPLRVPWLRLIGVDQVVTRQPVAHPALEPVGAWPHHGIVSRLYRVASPAPLAWWPGRAERAASPPEVFERLARETTPQETVYLPFAADQGKGRVLGAKESADRIDLFVAGEGGFLVVRRAFQPLWQAKAGDRTLRVVPADLALLGVEVPAGVQRVSLAISDRPERVASAVGGGGLGLLLLVALVRRRRGPARASSAPAR
jgi:hypothetical protein